MLAAIGSLFLPPAIICKPEFLRRALSKTPQSAVLWVSTFRHFVEMPAGPDFTDHRRSEGYACYRNRYVAFEPDQTFNFNVLNGRLWLRDDVVAGERWAAYPTIRARRFRICSLKTEMSGMSGMSKTNVRSQFCLSTADIRYLILYRT